MHLHQKKRTLSTCLSLSPSAWTGNQLAVTQQQQLMGMLTRKISSKKAMNNAENLGQVTVCVCALCKLSAQAAVLARIYFLAYCWEKNNSNCKWSSSRFSIRQIEKSSRLSATLVGLRDNFSHRPTTRERELSLICRVLSEAQSIKQSLDSLSFIHSFIYSFFLFNHRL